MNSPGPARRRWIIVVVAIALALGAGLLAWQYLSARSGMVALRPDDAAVVARGAQAYSAHCASCHGAGLEGQPNWRVRNADGLLPAPPHDASGHTWHHPDDLLFRITKYGVAKAAGLSDYSSAMQAYEGILDDADIIAALSWIKAQWPASIRAMHDQANARALRANPR